MENEIVVTFDERDPMTLTPVPMPFMASKDPQTWLAFQRRHVPGTLLDLADQKRVVQFMLAHKTEALTDGRRCYTLAGGMLAICDPINAVYGFSLGSGWFVLENASDWFVRGACEDGAWLEANLVGDELIIKHKVMGEFSDLLVAATVVSEYRVARKDQKAIDAAVAAAIGEISALRQAA